MEKCSPKFYDFNIYGKMQSRKCTARDHPEFTPECRVLLLEFDDHGLVRIVRDLTVKKYLGAGLMLMVQ